MAATADYWDENVHIIFDNTYCVKDKTSIDNILNQVSDIYTNYFSHNPEHFVSDKVDTNIT